MVSTVPKHVVIVRIMKHVILTLENVMVTVVCCRVISHLRVMNVDLNLTDLIVAQIAVCTVTRRLVTVALENACMVVHPDIKSPIASCLACMDIMEMIAPRNVETV